MITPTKIKDNQDLAAYIKKNFSFSYSPSDDQFALGRHGYLAKSGLDYQALVLDFTVVTYFAEWIYSCLKSDHPSFQLVGMETSGIPLVSGISMYLNLTYGLNINILYLRKSKDSSGSNKFIEGVILKDVPIIFVDEHFFTGETLRKSDLIFELEGHSISKGFFLINSQYVSTYKDNFVYTLLDDTEVLPFPVKQSFSKKIFNPLQKISSAQNFTFASFNSYLEGALTVSGYDPLNSSLVLVYLNNLFRISFFESGLHFDRLKLSFVSNNYKVRLVAYEAGETLICDNLGVFWKISKDFKSKKINFPLSEVTVLKAVLGYLYNKNEKIIITCCIDRYSGEGEISTMDLKKNFKIKQINKVNRKITNFITSDIVYCVLGDNQADFYDVSGTLLFREFNILKVFLNNKDAVIVYSNFAITKVDLVSKEITSLGVCDEQTEVFFGDDEIILYSKTGLVKFFSKNLFWEVFLPDSVISKPLILENYILIVTLKGSVYVLDKNRGSTSVVYEFGDQVLGLHYLNKNRILCICCKTLHLFDFNENNYSENDFGVSKVFVS